MALNDGVRRYLDAGMALSQITRQRAEELVRDLVSAGEIERNRAQDFVEDLVKRSRETSEAFVSTVRTEVRRQLSEVGITNLDDLARRVADVLGDLPDAARVAARSTARRAGGATARARTTGTRTATAAKKTTARKATAAKKTTARKATAAKKTTVRKATAAKKTTARKATAAKKTAATKATATRKTAAKKTATAARKTARSASKAAG